MNTQHTTDLIDENDSDSGAAERPSLAEYADEAYQAIRAINHATITRPPLLAPVVYETLGNLAWLGHALDQALGQIATGLAASLEIPGYEVYEADGSDPAVSVEAARAAIAIACGAAKDLATSIEYAHGQLTWQGYRTAPETAGGDL